MADKTSISIDNNLLIKLVEQMPVLWDNTIDLYKNRVATEAAWNEVMIGLYPDYETWDKKTKQAYVKLIIRRWTHIRDNYNRSNKKIRDQKRLGLGGKTVKPYVYSKPLLFLEKRARRKRRASSANSEDINTESENHGKTSPRSEHSESNLMDTNDLVTEYLTPELMPNRSTVEDDDNMNPFITKMVKFIDSIANQEPRVTNRHLSFFNGIMPTLNDFDDNEVLEFQMGVLQLLKHIKNIRQNR